MVRELDRNKAVLSVCVCVFFFFFFSSLSAKDSQKGIGIDSHKSTNCFDDSERGE